MDFWRFAPPDPSFGAPLVGIYDPFLVTLSVAVACLAGLTALLLVDRMSASRSTNARAWWFGCGAIAMGCGIWTMHFTGMLALSLPVEMGYDLTLTLVSLVPAILGSAAALYFTAQPNPRGLRLQFGALLMALGIGTMHYTGMEAMNLRGVLRYDFIYFCLSIIVAHILALAAIYIRFGLRRLPTSLTDTSLKLGAGTIMGFAVAGMHYTAMAASRFYELPEAEISGMMFPERAMAITISGFSGIILLLSGLATWIHRQRGVQRMLQQLAHTDALTGLPNRIKFKQRLEIALSEANRHDARLAVLFLDLNDFKTINDSLGHAAGDRVLEEVAARVRDCLRGEDTVARFGGDEFIIIARDLKFAEDAAQVADRVLSALQSPIEFDGWKLHHSASMGISVYPDDADTADELIQQADAAMYRAKSEELGYQFFHKELTEQAMERIRLGNKLREALHHGQLLLYYQPWVDLASGQWIGIEALARWPLPVEGWISPERFIPIAERSGLIAKLGRWALHESCLQGRAWLDAGIEFERLAVNVTAPQLTRSDYVDEIADILEKTRFPYSRLELELTESSLMGNDADVIRRLDEIRSLGITLAIDDFGTGYSSLSYLKDLPVDKLKIDRAFVKGIVDDARDRAIVQTVVQMGASLGFTVIAEGVETQAQRDTLSALGCLQAQGYLFARPGSAQEVSDLLATRQCHESSG